MTSAEALSPAVGRAQQPGSVSRIPVLMYHEIADAADATSYLAVPPAAFADQLALLRDEGWRTISAGALSAMLAAGNTVLPERTVVISFDDGYENFYSQAMPELAKHDFTATLFMTSGWVKEARPSGTGIAPMLSWAQLADAARAGIEIGGHTCTHPQLDQLSNRSLRDELTVSKRELEDKLGMEVPGVAYPFGYASPAVYQMAREAGYQWGYIVGNKTAARKSDLFAIPRLTIKGSTTLSGFQSMVNGADTLALRRDRLLTNGKWVVRRAQRVRRESR
jgi:peptidoglycan/xylan/chitin deacetylase (PgdA/CDA1 family)